MTKLTAANVLEKAANEQMEYYGKRLLDEGTTLISETYVPGKFVFIYIDLHAVENDLGGLSRLYRVYEIASEEMAFDECYDTAEEALEVFERLCAKYSHNQEAKQLEEDTSLDVSYVSVWNGGFEISSTAKWNPVTGEVFDITTDDNEYVENNVDAEGDPLEILDEQYIELSDGLRLNVIEINDSYFAFIEEKNIELDHCNSWPCHSIYDLHISGHHKGQVEVQFDDGEFNGVILFTSCYEEEFNEWNKLESRKLYDFIKDIVQAEKQKSVD